MKSKTETRIATEYSIPFEVASTSVYEGGDKEDAIEVRDRSSGADDSTP